METSRKAFRLSASACLLALAACSSGGGGGGGGSASPNTSNTSNTSNNSSTSVNIGTPGGTASAGSLVQFNFTTSLPPNGTALPLIGPVARASSAGITFPSVNDATATFRGTTVSGGLTYPVFDISIPSLSVSASNVKGDGTSVSLSNGGQFSATTASLNYLVLGVWTYTQPSNAGVYLGQTVTGSLTLAPNLPASGTAAYTGSGGVVGAFFVPSSTDAFQGGSLGGDVNMNVNFGANNFTGTFSNMHATTTAGGSGTTPWNDVSIAGTLTRSGSVSMNGATTTTGAPAGAGTAGFSSAAHGSVSASFYGPSGQEVGGSWTLSEATTSSGNKSAVGTFAAH